jgi:hypothetical protein
MAEKMSKEDFKILYKWFKYSQWVKSTLVKKSLKDSTSKEYYLINSNWIKDFKEVYNYDKNKKYIDHYEKKFLKDQNNITEDDLISKIYESKNFAPIESANREKIKIIDNKDIAQKYLKISDKIDIENYYKDFIIVDNNIHEILKKNYSINESPKSNISIGDKTFIIQLSNYDIEVGIIRTTYQYDIFLFQYSNTEELKEEIENLKNKGIEAYFNEYKIKVNNKQKIIYKRNGNLIYFINLNLFLAQGNNEQQIPININEIDISRKRGLTNSDRKSSKLNSIIQLITTIKEIKDYLFNDQYKEFIQRHKHIYILTSTLINIYNELYTSNKDDINKPFDLKALKIILDFIKEDKTNETLDQFLLFFLDTLHEELNLSEFKNNNKISLISFNSPYDTQLNSWNTFKGYYQSYFNSIISNCFNWVRKENNTCSVCHNSLVSFQAFPFIEFDLDKTHSFILSNQTEYKNIFNQYRNNQNKLANKLKEYKKKKENQPVHIQNCFDYYSNFKESNNKESQCNICNRMTKHISNYLVYNAPKYFIFIIKGSDNKNIKFEEELNLETFVDENSQYKIYNLLGVLYQCVQKEEKQEKHYFSILKDKENRYKRFDDDKITDISLKEVLDNDHDRIVKLLIYRGIEI